MGEGRRLRVREASFLVFSLAARRPPLAIPRDDAAPHPCLRGQMRVKRAAKYGFCSGVRIADLKVKRFAAAGGRGAILGEVVHNERAVEEMEKLGVRTVEEITAVEKPTIVFSAHGVPPSFHN